MPSKVFVEIRGIIYRKSGSDKVALSSDEIDNFLQGLRDAEDKLNDLLPRGFFLILSKPRLNIQPSE